MSLFKDAFTKIGQAVDDMSSLDVITFKGSVEIKSSTDLKDFDFDDVLTAAKASQTVDIKLLASTRVKMDGDVTVFYDNAITDSERSSHEQLVTEAAQNRKETVSMIKDILGDAVKDI